MNKELKHPLLHNKVFKGQHFDMQIKDQIVYLKYQIFEINIDKAKQIVAERISHMQPISYPVLIDITNVISIDQETMQYMAGTESAKLIRCAAFLINKEINNLTYEAWTQFKLLFPVKSFCFEDKDKAIEWLKFMSNTN